MIVISQFVANKPGVLKGDKVTLSWTVTGATSVSLQAIPGGAISIPSNQFSGTKEVTVLTSGVQYRLTATGTEGTVTADVVVELVTPGIRLGAGISTTIQPHYIPYNGVGVVAVDYQYQNNGTHVRRIKLLDSMTNPNASVLFDTGDFTDDAKAFTVAVQRTANLEVGTWVNYHVDNIDGGFDLTNINNGGGYLTVDPPGPPTVQFASSHTRVATGTAVQLKWYVVGATSINIDNGIGTVGPSGAVLVTMTQTKTFTITATGPSGVATVPVTVEVITVPVIQSLALDPPTTDSVGPVTLSWSVIGADNVTLYVANPLDLWIYGTEVVPLLARHGSIETFDLDPESGTKTFQIYGGGETTYAIKASNFAGTAVASVTLSAVFPPGIEILNTSPLLPTTNWNQLSYTFSASGGYGPDTYVWSIPEEYLPRGTTFSAAGVLSGRLEIDRTQTISIPITVKSRTYSATKIFTIDATYVPPVEIITTSTLPQANQVYPYTIQFQAIGGLGPGNYQWTNPFANTRTALLNAMDLPPGTILDQTTGVLTGQMSGAGRILYNFKIMVTSGPAYQIKDFSLLYEYLPVRILTDRLPVFVQNQSQSFTMEAVYGSDSYNWTVVADTNLPNNGALPSGLTLDASTGVLSGTPTIPGYYTVHIQVTSGEEVDVRTYELIVGLSGCMDPYHNLFYRVLDSTGSPIFGLTNDKCPNNAKQIIGRLAVGFTVGTEEIELENITVPGGGLAPDFQEIPESQHFWDLGYLDGKPFPIGGATVIYLPAVLLQKFTRDEVTSRVKQIVPMGVLPVVRFYDGKGVEV